MSRACTRCGMIVHLNHFEPGRYQCKTCRRDKSINSKAAWYERSKASQINNQFLRNYGITTEERDTLYRAQEGKCALCERFFETLSVDHDHETKIVRGLLCTSCNFLEGAIAKAHPNFLKNLPDYLKRGQYG